MFIVDEKGDLVDGSTVTALVALNTLKKYPGAKILYNLICSRSVPELIETRRRQFRCARKSGIRSSKRSCANKTSSSAASTPGIFISATTGTPIRA